MNDVFLRQSITIAPEVICRELGGELIILNLENGTYFGLDEIGARIWQLIQEHGSLDKVFAALCDEYEASADTLRRDLLNLVNELCTQGLTRVSTP